MSPRTKCPVCAVTGRNIGSKIGRRTGREFSLMRCPSCGYVFVVEPWTDFDVIYDDAYYRGEGSDPLVDYAFEYEHAAATIRCYEWKGVQDILASFAPPSARWLDFGSGTGGLVRYLRGAGYLEAVGYDTGSWAARARADGLPILTDAELDAREGSFDVLTAIEVIEHVLDPLDTLRKLRRLLRPGGILFVTTGNSDHAPSDFTSWGYVQPEIHVGYFTPKALRLAFEKTGFQAVEAPRSAGWNQIVRFKVLKSLRCRRARIWERLLPWTLLGPVIDARHGCSAFPLARATE